ncbi:MAG: MFS transporter [Anaerolineae bacterium]|nr:MFS transporter [Anaerolineae bacterium]
MSTVSASSPLPRGLRGYGVLLSRNAAYRTLWAGSLVSQMGDWFNTIALLGLLVELTGNPGSASLALVLQTLPLAFAGLFLSGPVVDRFDRRRVLVVANLARGAVGLSYLMVRDPSTVWLAYLATAGLSFGAAFVQPALLAATPNLVTPEELPTANALNQSTFATTLFLGSFLGGVVAQALGRETAFVLNALSFWASALFISRVRAPFSSARDHAATSATTLRLLVEGVQYLARNVTARTYVSVKLAQPISFGAISLFSAYALFVYDVGDIGTSWLYAARGLGAFFGPLLVNTLLAPDRRDVLRWLVKGGLLVNAAGYTLFALSTHLWQGVLSVLLAHLGAACVWTFSTVILQASTPDHYRGRVMALDSVTFSVAYSASVLVTGAIAAAFGPQVGALAAALSGGACGLLWIIATWKL